MNLVTGPSAAKRGAATIGVRPEHVDLSTTAGEWPARVRLAEHLGSDTFVYVEADNIGPMTVRLSGEAPNTPDQRVFVTPQEPRIHRFDKEGQRINS
jgi:multiple sugar transport system ATP-binding protein